MSGEIGDILSVDFNWMLDTKHGADYFRRWHSAKKNSGGLLVHKATHHFDLVNWWLSAIPTEVMATGKREFYTPEMAVRMGLQSHHKRCRTCPEKSACGFHINLGSNPNHRSLYLDNEQYDGYYRDQCVFRPEIDIEDTLNVLVKYNTGATLSYSLNAFNAWEGYQIAFNGTKGRLEHSMGVPEAGGSKPKNSFKTRIIPLRGAPRDIQIETVAAGHGGGDRLMLDDIFLPTTPVDKYLRYSDERSSIASIAVGIAANQCLVSGRPVRIDEVLPHWQPPEYPPMPTRMGPVPMPFT
jgi:predicted dehydrogenase